MDFIKKWNEEKILFSEVNEYIKTTIEKDLRKSNIKARVDARVKSDISVKRKMLRDNNDIKRFHSMNDKSGVRVVCHYISDIEKVASLIKETFQCVQYDDKRCPEKPNWIGYQAIHIDVKPKPDSGIKQELIKLTSEVQIKTALQSAWGDNNHNIAYKPELDIPLGLQRKVNILSALIEVADNEFEAILSEIKELDELSEASILYLIDDVFTSKFNPSYNINFTKYFIKRMHSHYQQSYKNRDFKVLFNAFINEKYESISHIFENRKPVGDSDVFFKQPEFLLIYFSLLNDPFTFRDAWSGNFNIDDLITIASWCGIALD